MDNRLEATWINNNGNSITLRSGGRPYFLQNVSGTGNMKNNISTVRVPKQDGGHATNVVRDMREIPIEGTIIAKSYDEAYELHRPLQIAFGDKEPGIFIYRGKRIPAIVDSCDIVQQSVKTHKFMTVLLCPSPLWQEIEEQMETGASYVPLFQFPLEFTEIPSFEFGSKKAVDQLRILNGGDVPCGAEFIFTARYGSVTNPRVTLGNAFIQINKTLQDGESVSIFTHEKNTKVTLTSGGVTENAIVLLDFDSTYIQLPAGNSELHLRADSGIESLDFFVRYRPLYLGV